MGQRLSQDKARRLRRFLAQQIERKSPSVVNEAVRKFAVSRQTVNRVLNEMIRNGDVVASGNTRARRYDLVVLDEYEMTVPLEGLDESTIWHTYFSRFFTDHRSTAMSLANFAFTEMVNNAIDHSEGTQVAVSAKRTVHAVGMAVRDDGIGIFRKIQRELELEEPRHAILEIAKGKLTTDPSRHSGMGIFFSSRACESFAMRANGLTFTHSETGYDFLFEDSKPRDGTAVSMVFNLYSTMTLASLFKQYEAASASGFTRTIIPVRLSELGKEALISRSQAKRVLTRVERFTEVAWDFAGVDTIGQAFADEIFRVFQLANPDCHFTVIDASGDVRAMVRLALATLHEQSPSTRPATLDDAT